jgi:hypothetical protein
VWLFFFVGAGTIIGADSFTTHKKKKTEKQKKENVAAFRPSMRHLPAFQRGQPSVVHQTAGILLYAYILNPVTPF